MRNLSASDFYQIRGMARLSDGGFSSLSELYLPLIGARAAGLYLALYQESLYPKDGVLPTHESLFLKTGLTPGEFALALSPLEALGLLRTFFAQDPSGTKVYSYEVYAPKSPKDFLGDVLLSGSLLKAVGEEAYKAIKERYALPPRIEGMEEVSMSFPEYFHPDLDDPVYANSSFAALLDGPARLALSFDSGAFALRLTQLGFDAKKISEEDLSFLADLSALYGLPGESTAEFAYDCLRLSSGKAVLDREKVKRKMRDGASLSYLRKGPVSKGKATQTDSDSPLAKKVRIMETYAPAQYLSLLQGGRKPASTDLRLVEDLHFEIGLSYPAINALVDYVLTVTQGELSRPLAEKLGAELVRKEAASTARDAMECLNASLRERRKAKKRSDPLPEKEIEPQNNEKEDEDSVSEAELEAALRKAFPNG